jgi:hypothetical protein
MLRHPFIRPLSGFVAFICVENIGSDNVKAGQEFEKQVMAAILKAVANASSSFIDVWLAALDLCSDDAVAARIAKHCVRRLEHFYCFQPIRRAPLATARAATNQNEHA